MNFQDFLLKEASIVLIGMIGLLVGYNLLSVLFKQKKTSRKQKGITMKKLKKLALVFTAGQLNDIKDIL